MLAIQEGECFSEVTDTWAQKPIVTNTPKRRQFRNAYSFFRYGVGTQRP